MPFTRIPRLLLTNDDGFDAPGLSVLIDVAKELADEIWVIAPEHDQSGRGQSINLNEPIRCHPRGERRWSVSGTPADCVVMAVSHFMADAKPSFILSGVNSGGNIGDEVNLSGTLGAAFTGLMLGIPSLGISQVFSVRKNIRWDTSRAVMPKLLRYLMTHEWPKDRCLSINIPDCAAEKIPGFSWAVQSEKNITNIKVDAHTDHRDRPYYWLKVVRHEPDKEHSDYAILRRHEVSVTAVGLNRSVSVDKPSVTFGDMP